MKTLRKGFVSTGKFKRVKDSTKADWENIKKLLSEGWEFTDKATWRRMRQK